MKYGLFYALTDFFDKITPASSTADPRLLKETLSGLKRLDAVQRENPWVTVSVAVGGGIWVFYQNRRRWFIVPAQRHLRLETAYGVDPNPADIEPHLAPALADGNVVDTGKEEFKQWRVTPEALPTIWSFFEALEKPPQAEDLNSSKRTHPRYFPGEVRQMALDDFIRDGRVCPGVDGRSKPHRLDENGRIEFDHILPYAKGGPSTYRNIQVLCTACNRLKTATAA